MRSFCWSCVLGLLCMPAGVLGGMPGLPTRTTSSLVPVNASFEITCSTALADPVGVSLKRRFQVKADVLFLSLVGGRVTRETKATEFEGRVRVAPQQQRPPEGHSFRLQLSRLGPGDTDLYYCQWTFMNEAGVRRVASDANLIIVTEGEPGEQCQGRAFHHGILAGVGSAALMAVVVVVVIARHRRAKGKFRPGEERQVAPLHVPPRPSLDHRPYLVTSPRAYSEMGFA